MKCVSREAARLTSWLYQCGVNGCSSLVQKVSVLAGYCFNGLSTILCPCFSSKRQVTLPPNLPKDSNDQKKRVSKIVNSNVGKVKSPLQKENQSLRVNSVEPRRISFSPKSESVGSDLSVGSLQLPPKEENKSPRTNFVDPHRISSSPQPGSVGSDPSVGGGQLPPKEENRSPRINSVESRHIPSSSQPGSVGSDLSVEDFQEIFLGGEANESSLHFGDEEEFGSDMEKAIEASKGEANAPRELSFLEAAPNFVIGQNEREEQLVLWREFGQTKFGESSEETKEEPLIPADEADGNNWEASEEGLLLEDPNSSNQASSLNSNDDADLEEILKLSAAEQFTSERNGQDDEFNLALAVDQSAAAIGALEKEKEQERAELQKEASELIAKISDEVKNANKNLNLLRAIDVRKKVLEQNAWQSWSEEELLKFEKSLQTSAKALLDQENISFPADLYKPMVDALQQRAEAISDFSKSEGDSLQPLNEVYTKYLDTIDTIDRYTKAVFFWKKVREHIKSKEQGSSSESPLEVEAMPPVFSPEALANIRELLISEGPFSELEQYLAQNWPAQNVEEASLESLRELHERAKRGLQEIFAACPESRASVQFLKLGELFTKFVEPLPKGELLSSSLFKVHRTSDVYPYMIDASKEEDKIHIFSLVNQFNSRKTSQSTLISSEEDTETPEDDVVEDDLEEGTHFKPFELINALGVNPFVNVLNEETLSCLKNGYLTPSSPAAAKALVNSQWEKLEMPLLAMPLEDGGEQPVHFLLNAGLAYGDNLEYVPEDNEEKDCLKHIDGRFALANFTMQFEYALSLAEKNPEKTVSLHLDSSEMEALGNDPEIVGFVLRRAAGIFQNEATKKGIKNIEVIFEIDEQESEQEDSPVIKCARVAGFDGI